MWRDPRCRWRAGRAGAAPRPAWARGTRGGRATWWRPATATATPATPATRSSRRAATARRSRSSSSTATSTSHTSRRARLWAKPRAPRRPRRRQSVSITIPLPSLVVSYYRVTTKVERYSYFYWFLNSQQLRLQIEFIRNESCHNLPIFWHPVLQNCRMYIICTYLQYKFLQQYLPSAADNTPHCTADTNLNWWRRCQWSAAASNHCVHLSTVSTLLVQWRMSSTLLMMPLKLLLLSSQYLWRQLPWTCPTLHMTRVWPKSFILN